MNKRHQAVQKINNVTDQDQDKGGSAMNNKNTNPIPHSSFCLQQREVHFNQKGFSLVGALIGGVISLIIIGTVNDLVARSIKSSNKAEKAIHTLNDKQRIINWFDNELICAETLKNYPLSATEKADGIKVLYDSTTELKIKNPQGNVLENFNPGSSNSIESIVIKQTSENNYALLFYEKSSNSQNSLYERKPQKADQIIVACGSTTSAGDYVIDKCGSSCVSKCNSDQELSPEGLCVPISTCTGGQLQKNDDGSTTCTCPGELIVDETTGECREGKDCDFNHISSHSLPIPHTEKREHLYTVCFNRDKNPRTLGTALKRWCITEQGSTNDHEARAFKLSLISSLWIYSCKDGELELVQDPYKPGGNCTTKGFIDEANSKLDPEEKKLQVGDVISETENSLASPDSPPSKRCY